MNKTQTAIQPGQDFSMFFSQSACHSLIFCRSAADTITKLKGGPSLMASNLPTSCGGADSLSVNGIELRALLDTYGEGAIHLSGEISKSGTCYEASGSFSAHLELGIGVDRRSITARTTVDDPDVDVILDWYCSMAVWGVLGYLNVALEAVLSNLANVYASTIVRVLASELSLAGFGPTGMTIPLDRTLSLVSVALEGLTLQGKIEVYVPFVSAAKFISIQSLGTTREITGIQTGSWVTQISCEPQPKNYTYDERQQRQDQTFDLESQFVTLPLTVTYALRGSSRGLGGLPGASGPSIKLEAFRRTGLALPWHEVIVPNVECTYPLPFESGGSTVTQDVHLEYLIEGTSIQIRNAKPEEGNFYLLLEASVLDGSGTAPADINSTPQTWILFEGDIVTMEDAYMNDYLQCEIKRVAHIPRNYLPTWDFKVDPSPAWQTFQRIRGLSEMEARGELASGTAAELLLHSQIARGRGFLRALHSFSSVQFGLAGKQE